MLLSNRTKSIYKLKQPEVNAIYYIITNDRIVTCSYLQHRDSWKFIYKSKQLNIKLKIHLYEEIDHGITRNELNLLTISKDILVYLQCDKKSKYNILLKTACLNTFLSQVQ